MPAIPPATISFQLTDNVVSGLRKDSPSPPILSPGEVLIAEVSEKIGSGKFLITLKNVTVSADSAIPLRSGARLMVRVEQAQPRIVLSIIEHETPETLIINDYLKMQKANPDSLISLIKGARELLNSKNIGELSSHIAVKDMRQILGLIDKIILSPGNLQDPLFLKDFVSRLGLLWEGDLKKAMKESPGEMSPLNSRDNLKSLLMKLSVDLRGVKEEKAMHYSETSSILKMLAEFADASVKSIEMQQVINVLAQEKGIYMLQIPFLSPEGVRQGDIFIEFEREKSGKDGSDIPYAVVIFLNMDALGDIMIEAKIRGEKIGCVIKCNNNEVCDFISLSAKELEKKLLSLGYKIDRLSCIMEDNLPQMQYEYLKDQGVYGRDVVDFFA